MSETRYSALWIVTGLLLLAAVLYVSGYYALVVRVPYRGMFGDEFYEGQYLLGNEGIEGDFFETVFTPMHWVDQQLRPQFWDSPVHSSPGE